MKIENLIRKEVQSLKPYVPSEVAEEVMKELNLNEVINLSTNESVLGPSAIVQEALKQALISIHQYPDGLCTKLRKDIASILELDADMIIITNGGDELLYLLGSTFLNFGDEVIVGEYGFKTYESVTILNGGKLIRVPFQKRRYDLAEISNKVTKKTKIIFLCNPHNPNGTIFTHKELENFLSMIPQNVLIVLDEAYADFVEDHNFPDSIKLIQENKYFLLVLRTFSKIGGMAGLRIGYGLASGEIINVLKKVQPPYSVNYLAQIAAKAFLTDTAYRQSIIQTNKEGKYFLYREFDRLQLSYIPSEANFIFVNLGCDADSICSKLMSKGILVRSGKIWGCPTYIRVTIGTEGQNHKFISTLEKILAEQ